MEDGQLETNRVDDELRRLEQETKLEEAKAARLEAERRHAEQAAKDRRERSKRERREARAKVPLATWLIVVVVIVATTVIILGVVIPASQPTQPNKYYTDSDLEKVVDISELSTVEYVYRGIAERVGWFDRVDLRIKYEAHVRASFDMSSIKIHADHDAKTIEVTLPEPTIQEPELNENEFGYLPESAVGDLPDIIRLCREDAISEVRSESQIKERAYDSIKSTVQALTEPLIGDYNYEWVLTEEQVQENSSEEAVDAEG